MRGTRGAMVGVRRGRGSHLNTHDPHSSLTQGTKGTPSEQERSYAEHVRMGPGHNVRSRGARMDSKTVHPRVRTSGRS